MRLLIAGGGTGGHLFPGMAVAEEVKSRGGEVLFVGTARGIEARVVPQAGYPLELIEVSGLKRTGALGLVRGLSRLPLALVQSLRILRRFRPDVVLGVGGYASGPLVMAASLLRWPSALLEQNSIPGFTNRTLGRFVRRAFIAFPEARGSFPGDKVVVSGNPVRRSFLEATRRVETAQSPSATPRLFVSGGSQGARGVNDLVLSAMETWAASAPGGRPLPTLLHQTGSADLERITAAYTRLGPVERLSARPFVEDMVSAYAAADLVIARAGAMTLAELAILGKPAILIPLPTAADDHQSHNAAAFSSAGAAVVLDQRRATGAELAALVADLIADPARRERMGAAMRSLGRPNAAKEIVDQLGSLAP